MKATLLLSVLLLALSVLLLAAMGCSRPTPAPQIDEVESSVEHILEVRLSYYSSPGVMQQFGLEPGAGEGVLSVYREHGVQVLGRKGMSKNDQDLILHLALDELRDVTPGKNRIVQSAMPSPVLSVRIGTRRFSVEYGSYSDPKMCGPRMAKIWDIIEKYFE